jgi:hypothetical protein
LSRLAARMLPRNVCSAFGKMRKRSWSGSKRHVNTEVRQNRYVLRVASSESTLGSAVSEELDLGRIASRRTDLLIDCDSHR